MCEQAVEQVANELAVYSSGSLAEEDYRRKNVDAFEAQLPTSKSEEGQGGAGGAGKAQFYIEVDASAMANLKAGTQYTLVPVDARRRATAPAAATAAYYPSQQQQQLDWCQPIDGRLPESDVSGNPGGAAKDELTADTFSLDQSLMNGLGTNTNAECTGTYPGLDTDFEGGAGDGSQKMTYTPLIPVFQQQHQQDPAADAGAAAAAAASHMHVVGYDALRYRHRSAPMFGGPPPHGLPHQAPYVVRSRAAWAPYPTPVSTHRAQAYLAPVLPRATPRPPRSSSMSATSTRIRTPDTNLTLRPIDEVPSSPHYSRGTGRDRASSGATGGSDLLGVARVGGMDVIQQMAGPLDSMPYYMPFNGRENHNEKERKRRTRIKNACQALRSLVPVLSEKTDKATVFEFTVQYLLHLRKNLGEEQIKVISNEFMKKYSLY